MLTIFGSQISFFAFYALGILHLFGIGFPLATVVCWKLANKENLSGNVRDRYVGIGFVFLIIAGFAWAFVLLSLWELGTGGGK